ncbi:MAG TPA: serine/threonine-protein kinase [Kiritimatiellia bacterium]|nr:serine/threonine-protein kinase [Kiritimatiellia bacterium]
MNEANHKPKTREEATPSSEPRFPGKGFRLGEFILEKTLGHGSMATVYLARDATGHEVAIKLFQEGPGVSPTMLERFRREAEASKKLRRHPNIMKVYATGQEGPYHFIVMEPVFNSRTLDDCMETEPLPANDILAIVIKIARALQFAHSRNIVHRDVKPANIMVDEFGEPLLTDFGVAALIDWPSCTVSGALTGTPLYMSPEQARSERAGPPTDVYSLGVVLYEALTGHLPYSVQHNAPVKTVLEAVKNEEAKRPRHYRKDLSPDLEAVILKALAKDPAERYPDAEAFAADLERAMAGRHVSARLFSYGEHILHFIKRYDQFFVAAFVMIAILVGSGFYFRTKLLEARYENLMTLLHLRNYAARIAAPPEPSDTESFRPQSAWNHIRMARRALTTGSLPDAEYELHAAISLSQASGDARTTSVALLELARIDTLNGRIEDAIARYRSILNVRDTSPATAGLAQLEALILTLLADDRHRAIEILGLHPLPQDGPLRDAILCLSGELSVDHFLERIPYMPVRLQNDAYLVAAVRHRMDGNPRGYAQEIRRSLRVSASSTEWPAPFARILRSDIPR